MFRATSGGNFPSGNANHGLKPNHFLETQESFNLHEHLDDILHSDNNESEVSFSVQKYSKKEILDLYKSTQSSAPPEVLSLFPIITSDESLTPMAFLPLDPREEQAMKYYSHRRVGSSGRGSDSTSNQGNSQSGGFVTRGRGRSFSRGGDRERSERVPLSRSREGRTWENADGENGENENAEEGEAERKGGRGNYRGNNTSREQRERDRDRETFGSAVDSIPTDRYSTSSIGSIGSTGSSSSSSVTSSIGASSSSSSNISNSLNSSTEDKETSESRSRDRPTNFARERANRSGRSDRDNWRDKPSSSENVSGGATATSPGTTSSSDTQKDQRKYDRKERSANSSSQWKIDKDSSSSSKERSQSSENSPGQRLTPKDLMWEYQDPQGEIQGPFGDIEMNEWYEAGYFSSSLLVKRVYQSHFTELENLTSSMGANSSRPFFTHPSMLTSASSPQPSKDSSTATTTSTVTTTHPSSTSSDKSTARDDKSGWTKNVTKSQSATTDAPLSKQSDTKSPLDNSSDSKENQFQEVKNKRGNKKNANMDHSSSNNSNTTTTNTTNTTTHSNTATHSNTDKGKKKIPREEDLLVEKFGMNSSSSPSAVTSPPPVTSSVPSKSATVPPLAEKVTAPVSTAPTNTQNAWGTANTPVVNPVPVQTPISQSQQQQQQTQLKRKEGVFVLDESKGTAIPVQMPIPISQQSPAISSSIPMIQQVPNQQRQSVPPQGYNNVPLYYVPQPSQFPQYDFPAFGLTKPMQVLNSPQSVPIAMDFPALQQQRNMQQLLHHQQLQQQQMQQPHHQPHQQHPHQPHQQHPPYQQQQHSNIPFPQHLHSHPISQPLQNPNNILPVPNNSIENLPSSDKSSDELFWDVSASPSATTSAVDSTSSVSSTNPPIKSSKSSKKKQQQQQQSSSSSSSSGAVTTNTTSPTASRPQQQSISPTFTQVSKTPVPSLRDIQEQERIQQEEREKSEQLANLEKLKNQVMQLKIKEQQESSSFAVWGVGASVSSPSSSAPSLKEIQEQELQLKQKKKKEKANNSSSSSSSTNVSNASRQTGSWTAPPVVTQSISSDKKSIKEIQEEELRLKAMGMGGSVSSSASSSVSSSVSVVRENSESSSDSKSKSKQQSNPSSSSSNVTSNVTSSKAKATSQEDMFWESTETATDYPPISAVATKGAKKPSAPVKTSSAPSNNAPVNPPVNESDFPALVSNKTSDDALTWTIKQLKAIVNNNKERTIAEKLLSFKNGNDVKNYVKQTLGTSASVSKFADSFIHYRKLESKNEVETTYSNPAVSQESEANRQTKQSQEAKKKPKGKKKLDPNLLGFSVSSNRIMQGEIESPNS